MLYICLILLIQSPAVAADTDRDPWEPFRAFVGQWTGEEEGEPGVGQGIRSYEFVLGNRFLHYRNRSRFEPQERNPDGETHEDWGFFSYDEARGRIVLRQFLIEGFVVRYSIEPDSDPARTRLISESIENGPPGMRARYTITFRDADTFEEVFEMASPGAEFAELIRSRWTRKPFEQ